MATCILRSPTETKKMRDAAGDSRKKIVRDGFAMFRFSLYLRHGASMENAQVHANRVKKKPAKKSKVGIIAAAEKQFSMVALFHGKNRLNTAILHSNWSCFRNTNMPSGYKAGRNINEFLIPVF